MKNTCLERLNPVIQQEPFGCGIASTANIVNKSYPEMQAIANNLGIYSEDSKLWSDTAYVRQLLHHEGVDVDDVETSFTSWEALPDTALLAIKHHYDHTQGRYFWHWVVFRRIEGQAVVLDSASYLPFNVRTDFAAMTPQWFIGVRI